MKIIENCWEDISATHCVFGVPFFNGDVVEIYIYSGLSVWSDQMEKQFDSRNEHGVGNCKLIFRGVKAFTWDTTPYSLDEKGNPVWGKFTRQESHGKSEGDFHEFSLDGTLKGMRASVYGEVEAESITVQIL